MPDRLPPLTALRAFDAAARHMSFAQAAAELNVTPAALSFQIKSLETHLGQPLFRRLNRAVELTEAGEALAPGARDGFEALAAAWRRARATGEVRAVTVTAGPALTAKWLAPRMFSFVESHPGIELRFVANLRLMDIEREEIDVAIRFGYGDAANPGAIALIEEWFTPMMTPQMATRFPDPAQLPANLLLHQDDTAFLDPPCDWPAWFRAAGLRPPEGPGPHFSQADHALDAAVGGAGAILGRRSIAGAALAEGRLVAPYGLGLTTSAHYSLLTRPGAADNPHVRAFIDWIRAEVSGMESLTTDLKLVAASEIPR